eukprot:COSAG01_NODE_108_length_25947_cov_25.489593_33_plen_435_part_00
MTSSPTLLRYEPRELYYAPGISSQVLRLTNTSPNSRLAFKIRSNRAHRYRLSHVAGVLLPAASVDVTIELAAAATATGVGGIRPVVTEQLDKFLVTAALVPASGAEYRTAAAAALWNNDGVAGAAAAATGAAQRQQVRSRVLPARVCPTQHVLPEPTQPPGPQHPPPPLPRVEVEPAAVEARQIISGRGAVLCLRNCGAAPVAFRFQVPSLAVLAVQPAMGLIAGGGGGTTSVRVALSADASREGRAAAGLVATSHSHSHSHANGDTAGAGSSRLRLSVVGLDRSSGALWYAAGAGGRTAGVDDGGGGDAGALIYAAALRRLWRRVDGDTSAAPAHRKEARVWSHIVHVGGVGEEVHEEESGALHARHPRSGTRRTPPLSSRPRDGSCAAAAAVSCVSPCDQFKCPITQVPEPALRAHGWFVPRCSLSGVSVLE